ncbi:hypothetical protein H0W26_04585 [Candidatus Dependentiae bacterium]|nr:hypothetical protein [Candidatus Dependentiae bacterium]
MAQQRPSERERYEQQHEQQNQQPRYENGLASDMKREAQNVAQQAQRAGNNLSPVTQGYILMGAGIILLLFSVGLFPVLKWVMVAGSIAMIIAGAYRSDFVTSISNSFEGMRNNNRR